MTSIQHAKTPFSSQDALGRALASRLNDGTQQLPHEVSERLKAARMLALEKRRQAHVKLASAVAHSGGGTAAMQMGGELRGVWRKLGAFLPLLALVAGLVTIDFVQDDFRAQEIADVDVELLTDDLPPTAYTDPGFAQFLRTNHSE